ncbi:transglutaminase-like domain-containing protein [soil metagenome]
MTFAERSTPRRIPFLAINAGFVLLGVLVAAWAAWPIYGSASFIILVVVSAVVGGAIAAVGHLRRWRSLSVAAITLGAYLVLGVPLAVPSALSGIGGVLSGWISLLTATVESWKQLATITTIPVGSYQTLLVPALVVFLVGAVVALSFAWRLKRGWVLVVPVLILMQGFGLVFGSAAVSASTRVLFLDVAAPRELLVGIAGFFVSLAFLLWRVQDARRSAIRSSQALAGIQQGHQGRAPLVRRLALGAVVLLVAVGVGAALSPPLAHANARSVLRSSIDPETNAELAESPLTDYRASFAADRYDTALFTVKGDLSGQRLRLAVMSYYDGQRYSVIDPSSDGTADTAFVRVPYRLDPGVAGATRTVTITVDGYRGLWLPTLDHLQQLGFTGSNAQSHSDGFFYNEGTASGIDLSALGSGDRYTVQATAPSTEPDVTTIRKPTTVANRVDASLIPESLVQWVRLQKSSTDGAGLADLITRLRDRGFLSHSLLPADAAGPAPAWMTDAGITALEPSYAGHSVARIDALFQQLLDKQNESAPDAASAQLVSAVGDDEQFAVAGALIAQYLGFPSRVVLGFDLDAKDRTADDIPACDVTCKGKNLTAWIEVQDAAGAWVALDTTPQHSNPVDTTTSQLKDPTKPTTVLPDSASEQQPPASDPSGGDTTTRKPPAAKADLGWLVTMLKVGGLSLLAVVIVLAPFALILFAKARRRSERRAAVKAEARIVGGWDEYIDVALDHGLAAPTTQTRVQVATEYGTPNGTTLATLADRAVFGPVDVADADGEAFWNILESETLAFARGMSRWQRIRAALSLRSFTRYLRGGSAPTKRR